MKFMCILHIQKNKNGIVLFEIVILIYSIDYKVVFGAAHKQKNYKDIRNTPLIITETLKYFAKILTNFR